MAFRFCWFRISKFIRLSFDSFTGCLLVPESSSFFQILRSVFAKLHECSIINDQKNDRISPCFSSVYFLMRRKIIKFLVPSGHGKLMISYKSIVSGHGMAFRLLMISFNEKTFSGPPLRPWLCHAETISWVRDGSSRWEFFVTLPWFEGFSLGSKFS